MPLSLRHRRLTAWFALAVLLLATLAPGITRAMAFVEGTVAPWSQVCSSDTSRDPASPERGMHQLFEHCPFCSLQADTPALPPAPAGLPVLHGLSQAVPALFLQAPRPLHAWAAAPPRGPPAQA